VAWCEDDDRAKCRECRRTHGRPGARQHSGGSMSERALTASELAQVAGVAAATVSGHLAQLLQGGLLMVEKQGRHRYFRLAGPDVAMAIEVLMDLAERSGQRGMRSGLRSGDTKGESLLRSPCWRVRCRAVCSADEARVGRARGRCHRAYQQRRAPVRRVRHRYRRFEICKASDLSGLPQFERAPPASYRGSGRTLARPIL
jgi:DNA-binding transcriptional ArsR family regulator